MTNDEKQYGRDLAEFYEWKHRQNPDQHIVEYADLKHVLFSQGAEAMQRLFRDHHAAAGHFSFSTDAQLGPWAQVAMGGEFKSPTL